MKKLPVRLLNICGLFQILLLSNATPHGALVAQQTGCSFENSTLQFNFVDQIEAIDFDGDSDLDLVIEDGAIDELIFLENDGNGNFSEVASLTVSNSVEFALGDLDGDGDIDVVTNITSPNPDRLAVYENVGNLNFGPAVFYDYPADTVSGRGPTIGDFDGDGDLDICVGTTDTLLGTTPQTLDLFVNDGTGVFTAGEILDTPARPFGIEFVDLNSDGNVDLVASLFDGTNRTVGVHINDGGGSFLEPVEYPAGTWGGIDVGDINNDSHVDIALAFGNDFSVVYGNGDGSFQEPVIISNEGTLFRANVGILDLDGDQDKELIAIRGNTNDFNLYINNGNDVFDLDLGVSLAFSPNDVATGDFNGDGVDDAAIGHSAGNLEILFFDCRETLLGDVNLDGNVDLLDVSPFVALLTSGSFQLEADINRDNEVNLLDIGGFVEILIGN